MGKYQDPNLLNGPPLSGPIVNIGNGTATPEFVAFLTGIFKRVGGHLGGLFPSAADTFVTNTTNADLTNAQVLANLPSGFVTVQTGSGILSSTGSNTINKGNLAPSGVTPGIYGDSLRSAQLAVDSTGLITAASNITISGVVPGGNAGGDLQGTYPNPRLTDVMANPGTYGSIGVPQMYAVIAVSNDGRITSAGQALIPTALDTFSYSYFGGL